MISSSLLWVAGSSTPPKTVITRILNFGTWEEFQEMKRTFSEEQILDSLYHPLFGQWTPKGKSFAECVYNVLLPDQCVTSYDV